MPFSRDDLKWGGGVAAAVAVVAVLVLIFAVTRRDGFSASSYPMSYRVTAAQLADAQKKGTRRDVYDPPAPPSAPERCPAGLKADQYADAEQELWYAATAGRANAYNTELAPETSADATLENSVDPSTDYMGDLVESVLDPRTKENHRLWSKEMKPWSGAVMIVDDLNEALEATTHFTGLRRPQPVQQEDPLQITERDGYTFAANPKFNFRG